MTLWIHEATTDNAQALAYLLTQLGYPSQPDQIVRRLAALPRGCSVILVAASGNEIVGLVQVSLKSIIVVEHSGEIGAMVVGEEWRGKGIGHALLKAAETWAAERSCSTMYVRSNALRKGAHAFYRQIGYEQLQTSLVFTKQLLEQE